MNSIILLLVHLCVLCIAKQLPELEDRFFRLDYDYSPSANGWFKLHRLPADWHTARLQCYTEGANLASPLDASHWLAIKNIQSERKISVLHSGVHATFSNGVFTSVEGVPLDELIIQWGPNEPRYDQSKQCMGYYDDGMGALSCNASLPYICFRNSSINVEITECGTVDKEYKLDNRTGHCYKYHTRGETWDHAMRICVGEGGHLAIINSDAEADLLKELFAKNPPKYVDHKSSLFLGYRRWGLGDNIWTVQGQTAEEAGYARWAKGEPSGTFRDSEKQSCVTLYHSGELDDEWCSRTLGFICEKNTYLSVSFPSM